MEINDAERVAKDGVQGRGPLRAANPSYGERHWKTTMSDCGAEYNVNSQQELDHVN